jgi:PKD repeat protein
VGNNPLTFAWSSTTAGVSIAGGTTSKPTITVATPGIYIANLAVTDSKGNVTNQILVLDWQFNPH